MCEFVPGAVSQRLADMPFTDKAKNFNTLYSTFVDVISPHTLNWQHPLFFGYFPSCNSYPSILGEMLSAGIGAIGLSWKSCPSLTELEFVCIHELIHVMCLPFVSGNILSSSSEAILISMIVAINMYARDRDRSKLTVYVSDIAHSSAFKAASILNLTLRNIPIVEFTWTMNMHALREQIVKDKNAGYTPLYVMGTFGTTSVCSCDNFKHIGEIAKEYNLYFHIDAAYAGSALLIRKYRRMAKGIEYANSMNINSNKLMLVNYDCTLALYKDVTSVIDALSIEPSYLASNFNRIDLRNYDISLSRRFRSLKLWLTIHTYGLRGIRRHIRRQFRLARYLARYIIEHEIRLEIINEVRFGLVCFRVRNSNTLTKLLAENLSVKSNMYFVSAEMNGIFFIRSSINNTHSRSELKHSVEQISICLDCVMGARDCVYRTQSDCNLNKTNHVIDQLKTSDIIYRDVDNNINKIIDGRRRSVSCSLNVTYMKKAMFTSNDGQL